MTRRVLTIHKRCGNEEWDQLVGLGRFELPTSPLSGVRSNQLSYRPISTGGAMRDRTADLFRAREALSQLSYSPKTVSPAITKPPKYTKPFQIKAWCPRRIAGYASGATTKSWSDLVGLGRFELPTSPLSGVRSNQLSYRPILSCLRWPWPRCTARSVSHILSCMLPPSLPLRLARPTVSCLKTPR